MYKRHISLLLALIVLCGASTVAAQQYAAQWLCLNSGAINKQVSDNYAARINCAQPVTGYSNSAAYRAYLGFWHPLLHIAVGIEEIKTDQLPTDFSLRQNYPNPFNVSTTIEFTVPHDSWVRMTVYNLIGQRVAMLVDQQLAAGTYRVPWDGADLTGSIASSGIYLYRLETDYFTTTRKMLLLK